MGYTLHTDLYQIRNVELRVSDVVDTIFRAVYLILIGLFGSESSIKSERVEREREREIAHLPFRGSGRM